MTENERKIVRLAMRGSGIATLHAMRGSMWSARKLQDGFRQARAWWQMRHAAK